MGGRWARDGPQTLRQTMRQILRQTFRQTLRQTLRQVTKWDEDLQKEDEGRKATEAREGKRRWRAPNSGGFCCQMWMLVVICRGQNLLLVCLDAEWRKRKWKRWKRQFLEAEAKARSGSGSDGKSPLRWFCGSKCIRVDKIKRNTAVAPSIVYRKARKR